MTNRKRRNVAIGVGVVAGLGGLAYYMSKSADTWKPPLEPIPNGEPTNGDPPMEDGWSENVTVENISVRPAVSYVGESIYVDCRVLYPHPAPLPITITGTIQVNGAEVSNYFELNFRNPTLSFLYTPTMAGDFIVRAQDKSASFKVAERTTGTLYCPWGGIRMPLPVAWHATDGKSYEFEPWVWGFKHGYLKPSDSFYNGYGEWNPAGTNVNSWMFRTMFLWGGYVTHVIPTQWTGCPAYWSSNEELAKFLARRSTMAYKDADQEHPYAVYDIRKQLAFWGSRFDWTTHRYEDVGLSLRCPHCGYTIGGASYDYLPIMRSMIGHIQEAHPQYLYQPSHGKFQRYKCESCGGTGRTTRRDCRACGGTGEKWDRVHVWGMPEF